MRKLKAVVRYDGTGFHGWQVQPGKRTVQGVIEEALSTIGSEPVRIVGAGRTDAGVHALGQVCSFDWRGKASPDRLRRSLSKMLGPDLRVESIEEVDAGFDARRSAAGKRYAYTFESAREPDPFTARYAWCIPWDIDRGYVERLAQELAGDHDFAGFRSSGGAETSTARTIHDIRVARGGVIAPCDASSLWRIEVSGNAFLYKMVRNIAGALIDIARGRFPERFLDELLHSPGPFKGHTAPARGLTLLEVFY